LTITEGMNDPLDLVRYALMASICYGRGHLPIDFSILRPRRALSILGNGSTRRPE
jgi:hypothetical protein